MEDDTPIPSAVEGVSRDTLPRRHWEIRLFGPLQILHESKVTARFKTRKAGVLLAYLALHPGVSHLREVLADVLWPDFPPVSARNNLRFVLSTLRRDLEPPGTPPGSVLRADNASIELRADAIATDVADFEAALASAKAKYLSPEKRAAHLQSAIKSYRSDLLPGYYDGWVSSWRERLREGYCDALAELARLREQAGDLAQAIHYATEAAAVNPLDETSHLRLIRLQLEARDPNAARTSYRKMKHVLWHELQQEPSDEAQALLALVRKSPVASRLESADSDADTSKNASPRRLPPTPTPKEVVSVLPSAYPVPALLTRFVLRPELASVVDLLRGEQTRLVTLSGPAGAGKSRLAIETATRLCAEAGYEAWFVSATEYRRPDLLASAVRDALRLSHVMAPNRAEQVIETGGRIPSLLILDGLEHLADSAGAFILDLLQRVPTLTCLVTSRVQLKIAGGTVVPVAPLPVPELSDSLEQLQKNPSFELLLDRFRVVRPEFALTPVNILEIAELCRRLEGIPLSLELAAPWIQVLSPTEILERLADPFALLVSDRADVQVRHRSLLGAIDASYQLLSPALQSFFARLSVFAGGFTLDAASDVLDEPQTSPGYLRELCENSLLHTVERGSKTHFYLLEAVRAYGWGKLDEEQRKVTAERHAHFYLYLGFEAESHMAGPAREEWLETLEFRMPNFRSALDWYLEHNASQHLYLTAALWLFWYLRGHVHEGRTRLMQALAAPTTRAAAGGPGGAAADAADAKATLGLACLAYAQGDADEGRHLLGESLARFRRLRQSGGTAVYLSGLARFASLRGNYELAQSLLHEALLLWREAEADERPEGEGTVLLPVTAKIQMEIADTIRRIGDVSYCEGNLSAATEQFEESLALFQNLRHHEGIAASQTGLAVVSRAHGDYERARTFLQEAMQIRLRDQDWRGVVTTQRILADIACREGRFADARLLLDESIATLRLHANFHGLTGAMTILGAVSLGEGDMQAARRVLRDALEMGEQREDGRRIAYIRCFLALAELRGGSSMEATTQITQSLRWFYETGDRCGLAFALEVCACVAADRGVVADFKRAAALYGAANALRTQLTAPVPPAFDALYAPHLQVARTAIGKVSFAVAQEFGASQTLAESVSSAFLLAP